jgi:hypothetical protein
MSRLTVKPWIRTVGYGTQPGIPARIDCGLLVVVGALQNTRDATFGHEGFLEATTR